MRITLLVRPGIDFVSLVFGLLKLGAVQVLIDPGMGLRSDPPAGRSTAGWIHFVCLCPNRPIDPAVENFRELRFNVTVGRRWLPGGASLQEIRRRDAGQSRLVHPIAAATDMPAAIIFTSGSTGPAKGVLYRHGNFDRQVTEIRDFYGIRPGEIDVSCFPLFGLFNAAMGVTSVIPAMDVTRLVQFIRAKLLARSTIGRATQSFGSPAVWNVVGKYCHEHQIQLSSLRRVFSCRAPVPAPCATKSMKACIHPERRNAHALLLRRKHCPWHQIQRLRYWVKLSTHQQLPGSASAKNSTASSGESSKSTTDRFEPWLTRTNYRAGQIGELIVRGPVVTTEYVTRTDANAMAKIRDDERGGFWHRMGDVGYFDQQDRFWFCGRMSQRVTCGTALNGVLRYYSPFLARRFLIGIRMCFARGWSAWGRLATKRRQLLSNRRRARCRVAKNNVKSSSPSYIN